MKRSQLHALAADAFHQVLDNGVFRVLALLCALPILFSFLVGFHEDGVSLLFGLKTWSYGDLLGVFGSPVLPPDPRGVVIEAVLQIVLQFLAGTMGVLVALAATSFFVPRLLERGAAELYFHKPVARWVLLLSRYFAGLLFVGLVSFVLVGGMYLGLLLVSHHNDPGILLSALALTYCFAPILAFTVLCGVVTRSTMASLLLASFFFLFNGCIHASWIQWQQSLHGPSLRILPAEPGEDAEEDGAESRGGKDSDPDEDPESRSEAKRYLLGALDAVHLVLPKTTDTDYLAQRLRKALDPPLFQDKASYLTLARLPEGLDLLDERALASAEPGLRDRLGQAILGAKSERSRYTLWRRSAEESESSIGGRVHRRVESASQAARTLQAMLEASEVRDLTRKTERLGSNLGGGGLIATRLAWREGADASTHTRAALLFKGARNETLFTLIVDSEGILEPEAAAVEGRLLTSELVLDRAAMTDWYADQLGFTAPLRFNIFFSVGSTLVFAGLLLGLGAWRLSRIAF